MRKIRIGDMVVYQTWSKQKRNATVEGIEICKRDEKYGRPVESCDIDKHNGVLDLSDNHWIYFTQVVKIIKTKKT